MSSIWYLFIAMMRAGLLGYGGGPSAIPLIRTEVVERYHWLSDQEFADALAIANTLPGPIATKLSAFVGYKVAGILGAASALIGMVAPTAIAVIVLVKLLTTFKNSPYLKGLIAAVRPVVVVLLIQTAFQASQNGTFSDWKPIAVGVASALALFWLKIDAPYVILGAMVLGLLFFRTPSV
ncbi:chromate transporter [Tumebacillus flagellatus]|uniref:Chromate transporter n=1 Tax=Tumebacillus flagellatus TaxID=1157490 RepID=A0A074LXL3_9BACL|nr:chromate transporter [Tumebacillus flagellatus]KEO84858.1 chromate transporter [Tumebacillus flagellatus]